MVILKNEPEKPMRGVAKCICSKCRKEAAYEMNDRECKTYMRYQVEGRSIGNLSDLFPDMPLWIAVGALDPISDGEAVCPDCTKS